MNNTTIKNISSADQVVRIAFGLTLVYSAAFQPGVLGLASILPLIAIYPILTGIIAWDPIYSAISHIKQRITKTSTNTADIAHA